MQVANVIDVPRVSLPVVSEDVKRWADTPTTALTPVLNTKRLDQTLQWYAHHVSQLQMRAQEIDHLVRVAVLQNMGDSASIFAPQFTIRFVKPTAELVAKPFAEVQGDLNQALQNAKMAIAKKIIATFDRLVEQRQVGQVQWFGPGVCRFNYYTAEHSDQVLQTYRQAGFQVTEKERTHLHLMHVHDLIQGNLEYPKHVKVPARVQPIVKAIPPWLQENTRVLVGQEISCETYVIDRRKERVSESVWVGEEITYRTDPALVLGCYVLAGWKQGET